MKNGLLPITLLITCLFAGCFPTGNTTDTSSSDLYKENKVKKETITQYRYISKFGEWEKQEGRVIEVNEYNRNGLAVKRSYSPEYGNQSTSEYSYNDNNQYESIIRHSSEGTTKSLYQYEGNKTIIDKYDNRGLLSEKIIQELNENNLPVSSVTYNGDGSLKSKKNIEYDKQNRPVYMVEYDSKGKLLSEEKYEYDKIGLKSWNINTSRSHRKGKRTNNDKYHRKFNIKDFEKNKSGRKYQKYDKKNRLIEEYNDDYEYIELQKYTYYDNGLTKEILWLNKNGDPELITVYEYEFR